MATPLRRFGWGMALAIFLVVSGMSTAMTAEFSADMVMKTPMGDRQGKVYVKGKMMRHESSSQGHSSISIVDGEKKKMFVLMPEQKMYMEIEPSLDMPQTYDEKSMEEHAVRESLGTETVNGYLCDKSRLTFKDKSMGTAIHWIAKKLQYPIRSESQSMHGKSVSELKNIKEGGVADDLFIVPKGYTRMQMPGMGQGMMGPGMKPGSGMGHGMGGMRMPKQ